MYIRRTYAHGIISIDRIRSNPVSGVQWSHCNRRVLTSVCVPTYAARGRKEKTEIKKSIQYTSLELGEEGARGRQ